MTGKALFSVVAAVLFFSGASYGTATTSATAQYPAAVETTLNEVADGEVIDVTWGNRLRNCIIAIETELGVDPASGSNTLVLRLAGIEAGAINSIAIGGTTPAAGAFTTLDCTGVLNAGSGNHNLTNAAGLIDGEKIQDDTIDDDSIDFSDITGADLTLTDCGNVTSSGTVQAATVNATAQFQLNGTQIATTNLSNYANIEMLNENETITGTRTYDDGTTDSPLITHKDGADETVTVQKINQGSLTFTASASGADDGVSVLGGNLRVGNGSANTTMDGEDAYIEGSLEVDGAVNLDGAIDIDSSAVNIDGGLVDIGGVTAGTVDGDNDLGVAGDLEVDGVVDLDGSIDANVTDCDINSNATAATAIELTASGSGGGVTIAPNTGGVDVNLTATGPFAVDGDLVAIGSNGADGNVADGDNDLLVNAVLEVDGEIECDGTLDVDNAATFDGGLVDIGGVSAGTVDGDNDLGVAGDLEVDGTTDLDGAVDIDSSGIAIDGGLTNVGGGSYTRANGDNDVGIDGDLEVNGSLQVDTLLDVNEDVDIDFDANDEEVSIVTSATDYAAGAGVVTVYASGSAGQTNAAYLLRLAHKANGDAQDMFILCEDNSDGTAGNGDDMFKVDASGNTTVAGTLGVSGVATFSGQLVNVGGGTFTTADGDNDLGVDGDLEVNGNIDADGNLTGDGASVLAGFLLTAADKTAEATMAITDSPAFWTNQGAGAEVTFNLPAAAAGLYFCATVIDAATVNINPADADRIYGTDSDGDKLQNTGTAGNHIGIVCTNTGGTVNWVPVSKEGTWSDAD